MAFISAYAPQSAHPADVRAQFFNDLENFYINIRVNDEKIICGDMIARLWCRFADEGSIIGEHFFRGIQKMPEIQANRNFLVQLCHSLDL